MNSRIIIENIWGEVIDRPTVDVIEIRWFDSTADLGTKDFQRFLDEFAAQVERTRRRRILTDATQFLMDRHLMDDPWREANIIPRYNSAGVKKFAFLVPEGVPNVGEEPVLLGPAKYPTGYFTRRNAALDWLAN